MMVLLIESVGDTVNLGDAEHIPARLGEFLTLATIRTLPISSGMSGKSISVSIGAIVLIARVKLNVSKRSV